MSRKIKVIKVNGRYLKAIKYAFNCRYTEYYYTDEVLNAKDCGQFTDTLVDYLERVKSDFQYYGWKLESLSVEEYKIETELVKVTPIIA